MWIYNNIRITVVDLKEQFEQILPKLQPIDAGTIYQFFGYINPSFPLQCFVVGKSDKDAIEALAQTGVAYTLSGAGYVYGDFYLEKATFQWMTSYKQTFREDKSSTDLIFKAQLDLVKA